MSLRFMQGQYRELGVAMQEVRVRVAQGTGRLRTDQWSPAWEAEAQVALTTRLGAGVEKSHEEERRAGVRRFYVPVAGVGDEPAALRGEGVDPRPEPRHEIARFLDLQVETEGGAVTVAMPGYESLGRLAPEREFREVRWPSKEEICGLVPEVTMPAKWKHFEKLYRSAWEMLMHLVKHPRRESGLPSSYIGTGAGFTHYQFVWDTSFTAQALAYGCRGVDVYASMNVLYSRQFDGGYIHREHNTQDGLPEMYEPDFSPNPPIMTIAEWKLYQVTGNLPRLRMVYPVLKGNHVWLRANKRLPDGTYWTTGLANGLDNSPSLGDGYPCLTAQMAHEAETLAKMARALGLAEEAAGFDGEWLETAEACNAALWDPSQQIYATSLAKGGFNTNKVVTAFWPLWAGIAPEDRIAALAGHLKDPRSFWRHHPIPSLAADSPYFEPGGQYWLGSTWAPTNYAAIKGFERAGRRDLAIETTLRHLQCMSEVLEATGIIWENYCSEKSERGSWCGPHYCWSALGPVALLLELIVGVEIDGPNRRLRWEPLAGEAVGVKRLPVGAATVALRQWQKDGKDMAEIVTDRAITVELVREGKSRMVACPLGTTRVEV